MCVFSPCGACLCCHHRESMAFTSMERAACCCQVCVLCVSTGYGDCLVAFITCMCVWRSILRCNDSCLGSQVRADSAVPRCAPFTPMWHCGRRSQSNSPIQVIGGFTDSVSSIACTDSEIIARYTSCATGCTTVAALMVVYSLRQLHRRCGSNI